MPPRYPTDVPAAKHDLLCPRPILDAVRSSSPSAASSSSPSAAAAAADTIDALTSAVVRSSLPLPGGKLPADVSRLASLYTYGDAPRRPRPLSGAPRVCRLVTRDVLDDATEGGGGGRGGGDGEDVLRSCRIAVKLPRHCGDDPARLKNAEAFGRLVRSLRSGRLAAVLAVDSAGRCGFVVPTEDGGDDGDYHATVKYADFKRFVPWARENHARNSRRQQQQRQQSSAEEPPGGRRSWTPPYTPPPEEECGPAGWDDRPAGRTGPDGGSWTPRYTPPPEEECGPRGWEERPCEDGPVYRPEDDGPVYRPEDDGDGGDGLFRPSAASQDENDGLFRPPKTEEEGLFKPPPSDGGASDGLFVPPSSGGGDGFGSAGLWQPDSATADGGGGWGDAAAGGSSGWPPADGGGDGWDAAGSTGLGSWSAVPANELGSSSDAAKPLPTGDNGGGDGGNYHEGDQANEAAKFYDGLTRDLGTRADSRLYHMRNFNGWVKATQIAELDPDTTKAPVPGGGRRRGRRAPLRVLDLACGKGGDLTKWTLHGRGLENYVGVDVARGSLMDAAKRARDMSRRGGRNNLRRCTFTLADLGEDVPGRRRSPDDDAMQSLLSWSIQSESPGDKASDPKFAQVEGGGISESDRFDAVSIQFAIHYMMSSRVRARRFFRTVSSLLEVGGNLIVTTIDARVVVEKLMGLGVDIRFDGLDLHEEIDADGIEGKGGGKRRRVDGDDGGAAAVVSAGNGACRLRFPADTLRRIFRPDGTPDDAFGLKYSFTLSEGDDHAAGVGDAVDLPEWLAPIPALRELAEEAGMALEDASNFHGFYADRSDPGRNPSAHNALYNMSVLNRSGSVSGEEWEVSRMYVALKFRKEREPSTPPEAGAG